MTNVQHSSASNEHYTPQEIIDAAHATMGGIDLDPATTLRVNETTVRAARIFTQENDGLKQDWGGEPAAPLLGTRRPRVFLNPPGGKTGNKSNAGIWWAKLVHEYLYGHIDQAIFLGFSIEILSTTQGCELWPGELPFCIPKGRIDFLNKDFEPLGSPTHANIIVYLPPLNDVKDGGLSERLALLRFTAAFTPIGKVRA